MSAGSYFAQWIAKAEARRAWAEAHLEEAAEEASRLAQEERESEEIDERRRRELRAFLVAGRLRSMGVPRNLADSIQADEERELRGGPRKWQTKAMDDARKWLASDKRFLLLVGDAGSGKSAAAAWTLLQARTEEHGAFVCVTEMARLSRFEDGREWDRLLRVPWLVVDDVGTETRSGFFAERFFELVNERYGMRRRTALSCNINVLEFKSRYGSRVESRLRSEVLVSNTGSVDLRVAQ